MDAEVKIEWLPESERRPASKLSRTQRRQRAERKLSDAPRSERPKRKVVASNEVFHPGQPEAKLKATRCCTCKTTVGVVSRLEWTFMGDQQWRSRCMAHLDNGFPVRRTK